MEILSLRSELRDFIMSDAPKPLLVIGDKGSAAREDAMKVASFLLSSDKPNLSQDYMYIGLAEDAKTLGVEDAERIIERSLILPSKASRQIILIDAFDTMTVPAQNKLLKLLEEPGTVLVIAVAYEDNVLATVKSRMQVVRYEPLSYTMFEAYCDEHGIGNPLVMYYITGGMPEGIGAADSEKDLVKVFCGVYEAALKGMSGIPEIFSLLHIVKEKDKQSFFETHRGFAGKMLSLVVSTILKADGINQETAAMMAAYNSEMPKVSSVSYTKDDFFGFFVRIMEGGINE